MKKVLSSRAKDEERHIGAPEGQVDIRPWNEKHQERRGQPFNTVPAEMHTQMINDRDATIRGRDVEIMDLKRLLNEKWRSDDACTPEPEQQGWWIAPFYLMIAFGLGLFLACSLFRYYPTAPKGTGDNIMAADWREKYLDEQFNGWKITGERDHWLHNCQAAWKALGCGHLGSGDRLIRLNNIDNACKALNQ